MTAGAVAKYLTEQNNISSINSLVQILEAHHLIMVKKVKGTYAVFIKLYSLEGNFTVLRIPFKWTHRDGPTAQEGIIAAKAQHKLEQMIRKK